MTSIRTELRTPKLTDQSGIVSWVHFGDLHMTVRHEQNYRDFMSLVEEVNRVMADSLNFAYLPGDNADHGKIEEYEVVREGLDRLKLPLFAIVGDHDVHSKSHDNFLRFMMPRSFYRLEVVSYCFFALDAFAFDDPKLFDLSYEQIDWLQQELNSLLPFKSAVYCFFTAIQASWARSLQPFAASSKDTACFSSTWDIRTTTRSPMTGERYTRLRARRDKSKRVQSGSLSRTSTMG